MRERKEILEKVLFKINNIIQYHNKPENRKLLVHYLVMPVYGLPDLIQCIMDGEDFYSLKNDILNDIEDVNNIKFHYLYYYEPFCEKKSYEIKTIDDLKLWYEKRIEALIKTIEYYNTLLDKNGKA
jgi:catalase